MRECIPDCTARQLAARYASRGEPASSLTHPSRPSVRHLPYDRHQSVSVIVEFD